MAVLDEIRNCSALMGNPSRIVRTGKRHASHVRKKGVCKVPLHTFGNLVCPEFLHVSSVSRLTRKLVDDEKATLTLRLALENCPSAIANKNSGPSKPTIVRWALSIKGW